MTKNYNIEDIKQYGVLGIEIVNCCCVLLVSVI